MADSFFLNQQLAQNVHGEAAAFSGKTSFIGLEPPRFHWRPVDLSHAASADLLMREVLAAG